MRPCGLLAPLLQLSRRVKLLPYYRADDMPHGCDDNLAERRPVPQVWANYSLLFLAVLLFASLVGAAAQYPAAGVATVPAADNSATPHQSHP